MEPDVLDCDDVCRLLQVSRNQLTTLIDGGEIRATSGAAPNTWAIACADLDAFVQRKYGETREFITAHPYAGGHLAAQLARSLTNQRPALTLEA